MKSIKSFFLGIIFRIMGKPAKTMTSTWWIWKGEYHVSSGYVKAGDMVTYL